jgi:hypothetical protein
MLIKKLLCMLSRQQMCGETESSKTYRIAGNHLVPISVYDTNYHTTYPFFIFKYVILFTEDPSYDLLTGNLFQALKF